METINTVPFSEPPYLRGLPSPYYNESHRRFQRNCRDFLWENLHKHALEWENSGEIPKHVFRDFAKANMLLPNLPAPLPVKWLHSLGIYDILGIKAEEWDYMHSGIYADEVSQVCTCLLLLLYRSTFYRFLIRQRRCLDQAWVVPACLWRRGWLLGSRRS